MGPDLKASGPPNRTCDFTPDARAADFDDSAWERIPADSLERRRGLGRLSLNWYRLNVTLPEQLGGFEVRGSRIVFEIVVDDYAEVWVNGKAPFVANIQKRAGEPWGVGGFVMAPRRGERPPPHQTVDPSRRTAEDGFGA